MKKVSKSTINAMFDSRFGFGRVYVTPVRMESVKHRNKGWHQDWFESEVPEWMRLVAGYDENVDGEVPLPILAKFEVNYENKCIELADHLYWDNLPAGTYNKLRGRNRSGKLLWEVLLSQPLATCNSDYLTITSITLQLP